MNKLGLIFLSLIMSLIICDISLPPRGWRSCNKFWNYRCDKYCYGRGFILASCWINKKWDLGFRGCHNSGGDWDEYYRRSLNNNNFRPNENGVFLQVENQSTQCGDWRWKKFVLCKCKSFVSDILN
jgi:hypothetical protein